MNKPNNENNAKSAVLYWAESKFLPYYKTQKVNKEVNIPH